MVQVPNGFTVVVGLGLSGQAICRHLTQLGRPFMVADTREAPPGVEAFRQTYPDVQVHCGSLAAVDFCQAYEVVISPGVDPRTAGLEGAGAITLPLAAHAGRRNRAVQTCRESTHYGHYGLQC